MNRNENRKNMIIIFALLVPVVIWFALKLAGCYEPELKLFDLLERLTESLNYPFDIHINEYSVKTALVFLLLYAMGIGIYFHQVKNAVPERNTALRNGAMYRRLPESMRIKRISSITLFCHRL